MENTGSIEQWLTDLKIPNPKQYADILLSNGYEKKEDMLDPIPSAFDLKSWGIPGRWSVKIVSSIELPAESKKKRRLELTVEDLIQSIQPERGSSNRKCVFFIWEL
eukprot:TRINITY_DN4585_c0_g1_i4.p1 TRINITY_DN4585_c0_g1~~TRINITY_DN4585_c0_g1_i4.p1  ORF type:complete len:106 (+),score=18.28 TRINITY_DN4585_c0_g1_i4:123-440(+)